MAKQLATEPVGLREAFGDRRLIGIDLHGRQPELVDLIAKHQTTVAAAGRQSGKSLIAAGALVHNLTLRPDLDELAGGATRHALCVANSREQAGITMAYARGIIERSPLLRSQLRSAERDRLVLEGGRILLAMPCIDRMMRGLVVSAAVLDELAHFVDSEGSPAQADRVFAAVRPSLATYGERGTLLAISTPLGSDNLFARLHARAASGELEGAAAFTAPTSAMNPRVSAEFLETERLLLGELDYAREYEAEFTGGGASFFEEDAVRAVVGRYRELAPSDGTSWVVGFDPSFSVDPSAAALVGRSARDRNQLLVARVERWIPRTRKRRLRHSTAARQVVTDSVLDAVSRLAREYGAPIVTDQHVPSVVVEGLRSRGVRRVQVRAWTPQSQTDAFRSLRAYVYAGNISLPDSPDLVSELLRLTTRLQAGASQVRIPKSGSSHCDMAVSVAAGVHEISRYGGRSEGRLFSPANIELPPIVGVPSHDGPSEVARSRRVARTGHAPTDVERRVAAKTGLRIWDPAEDPMAQ